MTTRALAASLLSLLAACAAPEEDETCVADVDCGSGERCVAGRCFLPQIEPDDCGNGVVDPPEECDLGLDNDDQGVCTSGCRATSCGDGSVQLRRGEACDEGAANSDLFGSCTTLCQETRCGDGVVDPGEGCDEGYANHDEGGACSSLCQPTRCGDGVRQFGESCDGEIACDVECRWADRVCGIRDVDAAGWTVLALREDGVLLGAGYNGGWRTLGLSLPPGEQLVPALTPLLGETRLASMEALDGGGVGLTPDGRIVTFGSDDQGARGDGPGRSAEPWSTIEGPALVRLEAQIDTVLGLDAEGRLWGFGSDLGGVLRQDGVVTGACPVPCVEAPIELFPDEPEWRFVALSLGFQHVLALRKDGTLWGWGRNDECQLGCTPEELTQRAPFDDDTFDPWPGFVERAPRRISEALEGSVLFLAGSTTTHVLDRFGRLQTLGVNHQASLGTTHDDRSYRATPVPLLVTHPESGVFVKTRELVWGSDPHILLRDEEGGVHGMGRNERHQSSTIWEYSSVVVQPTELPAGVRAARLAAGDTFSHFVSTSGALWAIGLNDAGQLGEGTLQDALEWVPVQSCP